MARNWARIASVASMGRNSAAGSPVSRDRKNTSTSRPSSEIRLASARFQTKSNIAAPPGRRPARRCAGPAKAHLMPICDSCNWPLVAMVGRQSSLSATRLKPTM